MKFDRNAYCSKPNRWFARLAVLELVALPSSRRTSAVAVCPICWSCWCRRRPQPGDQRQDFPEHLLWHRDLGHLEGDVAAVADHLGADLDQLLAQAGQRPRLRRLWHRQRPHEVAEVVGQRMELETHCVSGEAPARQPGPFDRVLAFLDPLLRCATLVVEGDDVLGRSRATTDSSTARQPSALCTLPGLSAQRSTSPNWLNTNSG